MPDTHIETITHKWQVSARGDITIVRIRDLGGNCQLEDTLFHLPAVALRYAIANATGTGDGYGRSGNIEDAAQEPQEAPEPPGAITEGKDG